MAKELSAWLTPLKYTTPTSINARIRMGVRLPNFTFWEEANVETKLLINMILIPDRVDDWPYRNDFFQLNLATGARSVWVVSE